MLERPLLLELDTILTACRAAWHDQEPCLLATLVKVEGSSYRRVGARMFITASGKRIGTLSGGCLEAEIQKKAWWLTENGPVIHPYQMSAEEDGAVPYGLGCGGTLQILLKRVDAADMVWIDGLAELRLRREGAALAIQLSGPALGRHLLSPVESGVLHDVGADLAAALERVQMGGATEEIVSDRCAYFVEAVRPRQRLVIFGAGNDAQPLLHFALLLGWDVLVADGRAHLATAARFPGASRVVSAPVHELVEQCAVRQDDAVVVMTHSFEQDATLLRGLLPLPLRYLGQLGPRHRTRLLLAMVSDAGLAAQDARLHSPIGLDIGAHTPETIALAIVAEVQTVVGRLEARPARALEAAASLSA